MSFHAISVSACFQQLHGVSLHANRNISTCVLFHGTHLIVMANQINAKLYIVFEVPSSPYTKVIQLFDSARFSGHKSVSVHYSMAFCVLVIKIYLGYSEMFCD